MAPDLVHEQNWDDLPSGQLIWPDGSEPEHSSEEHASDNARHAQAGEQTVQESLFPAVSYQPSDFEPILSQNT